MERELCPAATGALFIGDNGLGLHNGLNECPFFNEGVNCFCQIIGWAIVRLWQLFSRR